MILPIVAYGDPVLRKETEEIDANYPDLKQLIADMFETMYHSKGVGLAAPQIGLPIRIREEVSRKPELTIEYYNENFELVEEKLDGLGARVVQHEYDHIEGILFVDKINPLKKQLIKSRLNAITKGEIKVGYRMKFPLLKNKSL